MSETGRRFELMEVLGSGGFGVVYRAMMYTGDGFSREVALKLHNENEANAVILERQRDEARLLGLLDHPALVNVLDLTQLDGRWAIVMERVEGIDLHRCLEAGPPPLSVVIEIARHVADLLATVHEATDRQGESLGVLHRDIKPGNIMVTRDGAVRVLDFGAARARFEDRESQTEGILLGTLPYFSPERLYGQESESVDGYALAITILELATLRRPVSPSPDRVGHDAWRELATARLESQTDANLAALFRAMVSFEPSERPSARRVARSLAAREEAASLASWVTEVMKALPPKRLDSKRTLPVGTVLYERAPELPSRGVPLWLAVGGTSGMFVMGGMGGLLLAVLGVLGLGLWLSDPRPVEAPAPGVVPVVNTGAVVTPQRTETSARSRESGVRPVEVEEGPLPVPVPAAGRVRLFGDGPVVLVGTGGRFAVPGTVPVGTYAVELAGTRVLAELEVVAHQTVSLRCLLSLGVCRLE